MSEKCSNFAAKIKTINRQNNITMYTPKSREEYITKCRYYDGTEDSVYTKRWADYERVWVEWHFSEEGIDELKRLVKAYKAFGLEHFNTDDGIPMSLKALLWSRFMHWGCGDETPESFADWWEQAYMKES